MPRYSNCSCDSSPTSSRHSYRTSSNVRLNFLLPVLLHPKGLPPQLLGLFARTLLSSFQSQYAGFLKMWCAFLNVVSPLLISSFAQVQDALAMLNCPAVETPQVSSILVSRVPVTECGLLFVASAECISLAISTVPLTVIGVGSFLVIFLRVSPRLSFVFPPPALADFDQ
jgi:hypothetical protein